MRNERVCYNCVFKECGDSGWGSQCNLGFDDLFNTKPCYTNTFEKQSTSWSCKYFRTPEEMIELLDKESNP